MKFAIIAAGDGERLKAEGVSTPKPLVSVNGETMVDRLVRVFMDNEAEEIVVICNDRSLQVPSHLLNLQRDGLRGRPVPLRFLVKGTPSSMHSLFEISNHLQEKPFVLTTVDTLFREDEFAAFVEAFRQKAEAGSTDALMGVTDYIDDESPLYVKTDEALRVTDFLDTDSNPHYVSSGIYGLTPRTIDCLKGCIERGESRLRNFQRSLVREGLAVEAFPFSKVLDIDHASDIGKAEAFLKS